MSRIITFYGADHKCGTSQISLCIAKSIAKLCPSLNVLLVYIDSKSSDSYSPKVGEDIASIWPYVNEQILDIDELVQKAKYENNLSIIGGTNFLDIEDSFNKDGAQYLFNKCKEKYDIIICDSGSEITRALCLGGLLAADEADVVMLQTESALRKLEMERTLVDKFGIQFSQYIINKYDRDCIYTKDYCIKRLGISNEIVSCVVDSGYGDIAEMQSKSLLEFKSVAFKRSIENISRRIIADYGRV